MDLHNTPVFVVVDGGGTACRAALMDVDGNYLGRAEGGSANIFSDFDSALKEVLRTVTSAYDAAGRPPSLVSSDKAFLGLAGANVGKGARQFAQALPFCEAEVVSDRDIAIQGALGTEDGAVAQIGTGSTFSVRQGGGLRHYGGWGFDLSDECSGAALGRDVLRASVAAFDGLGPETAFTQAVRAQFGGTPDGLVAFAKKASPAEYAGFVPDLFVAHGREDPVAVTIVDAALARLIAILEMLDVPLVGRLCLVGSVGESLQRLLPDPFGVFCVPPKGTPLDGAFELARTKFAG